MKESCNIQIKRIILIFVYLFTSQSLAAEFAGGTGKPNAPYQIATAEQLISIGENPNLLDKHYVLINDIDLDPNLPGRKIFDMAVIAPDTNTGSGFQGADFTGVFDGNNHKISNLTIAGNDCLGLFGKIVSEAKVFDLVMETVDVNGTGDYVGGIVGSNYKGYITNCCSTGSVKGSSYVGGLVGRNSRGSITNNDSACTVSGSFRVGGLVGENWYGTVTTSNSTGTVSAKGIVGGFIGSNYYGSVTDCCSTGSVSGDTSSVGGLVGWNYGSIIASYSSGPVIGDENVGGLVGRNIGSIIRSQSIGMVNGSYSAGGLVGLNTDYGIIIASYSTGRIIGEENISGLVGLNYGSVATCYSTGPVNGISCVGGLVGYNGGSISTSYNIGAVSGNNSIGGLVGFNNNGSITSSFWDIETSGQSTSSGGTGLSTAQMQDINSFLSTGWDFINETVNGTCDYWKISEGDYPNLFYHIDNSPVMPEGSGTPEEPYLIRDARDLGTVWSEPLAHFRLENSLDLSGITWPMAVTPFFGGTFDGNTNVISNLHIRGSGFIGLFGQSGFKAKISNIGLETVDINGTGNHVGSLVGYNWDSSISRSYSTGTVKGNKNVGGLVGSNEDGKITSCYSTSSVSGYTNIGGLTGYHNSYLRNDGGIISTSFSTGMVAGDKYIGGLMGKNLHGVIDASFWDIETSGLAGSDGGVGLTTEEMMDSYMIGLNGFVNDPNWVLNPGLDYPRLIWEGTPGQIIPEPEIDWLEGNGSEENPYRISTANQLIQLGKASILWDKSFVLGTNIDLDPNLPDGKVFRQAVIPKFTGAFDGNGHVIQNLVVTGYSRLGLFGLLDNMAWVMNLGVVEVNVTGSGDYIGGLVGQHRYGLITDSYSTGIVSGNENVGGLAGENDYAIFTSYSAGTVNGNENVGGFVGRNYIDIKNSYSTSTVNGIFRVGGFVGFNNRGRITTSYSSGLVSGNESIGGFMGENLGFPITVPIQPISLTNFWDVQTSGLTNTCGGEFDEAIGCDDSFGKTTTEMQTASTFTEAGWDFDKIWMICEGIDYPRLQWQNIQCGE